jgi:hypothetical protein
MRTTLSIDQKLLREAKSTAAKSGETLSGFVEDAVREKLARAREISLHDRRPLMVIPKAGGLQPGVELDNNAKLADMMDEWDAFDRRQRSDLRGTN